MKSWWYPALFGEGFCEFDVDEVPIAIILFATGGVSVFINNLNGAVAKHSPCRLGDIA
jgi:hypothetical protein